MQFNNKNNQSFGEKNTGKKILIEDSELGYSDFTLALTFHLPHPQQKKHAIVPNA